MNCEKFQEEYLSGLDNPGSGLSAAMSGHLDHCPECREFVRVLDLLSGEAQPGPELDRRIREDFCRMHRRKSMVRLTGRILLPLAACLMLLCSLAVIHQNRAGKTVPRISAETALSQDGASRGHQDWDLQLMDTENEMENLEMEMTFLLTGL